MGVLSHPERKLRVLIIGGGTCGLALGQGLRKADVSYTIFERDSAEAYWNKPRDWGMQLHWGKAFLLQLLPESLQRRLAEAWVDPHYHSNEPIPHVNGATGQIIGDVAAPDLVRVSRKKLRTLLGSDQGPNIKFEKRLSAVQHDDSGVTAIFDDGTTERGDVVVGCDGSRSLVRQCLVGDAAVPENVGITMINHTARGFSAEQALLLRKYHPISKLCYDPQLQGIFLLATLDASNVSQPETWTFQVHHSWWGSPSPEELQDPVNRLKFFKERFGRLCEPFLTAGTALPDDEVLPLDPGQEWAPRTKWDNHHGMYTLAGDAAHSMLPHRGQGLNNALQDAAEIVEALKSVKEGKATLRAAISEYEDKMRPRGIRDVELSHQSAIKILASELKDSPLFQMGLQKQDQNQAGWETVINTV